MNTFKSRAIRYFWDPEPRNEDPSSMIWCLGQQYDTRSLQSDFIPENGSDPSTTWPPEFLDDFESRIWMTYRTDFSPIPRSVGNKGLPFTSPSAALQYAGKLLSGQVGEGYTSDIGWGCMIRSAQSLLANALVTLHLGREWRRNRTELNEKYVEILSWFADDPKAPFSIHKFVKHGEVSCAKSPGEWFGPAAASRCIQLVSGEFEPANLVVSVTGDQDGVYRDQVLQLSGDGPMKPTLLLIGKRLGHDNVNPLYYSSLKALLELPQSIGIAGGRPSSSHYFCASQGDYLFYLDPHHPRLALPLHHDLQLYTPAELDSCHTRRLRRIHLREMDPSMLIAFLIKDHGDWLDWLRRMDEIGKTVPAVIHIFDTAPPKSPAHEDIVDFDETEDDEENTAGVQTLSEDEDTVHVSST